MQKYKGYEIYPVKNEETQDVIYHRVIADESTVKALGYFPTPVVGASVAVIKRFLNNGCKLAGLSGHDKKNLGA